MKALGSDVSSADTAPLRRRLRARGLRALVRASGWLPPSTVAGGLASLAACGLPRRYHSALEDNVAAALPGLAALDPRAAARVSDTRAFGREVARFAAEQASQWIRLARGARGARGGWVDDLVEIDASVEGSTRFSTPAGARSSSPRTSATGSCSARLARRGHGARWSAASGARIEPRLADGHAPGLRGGDDPPGREPARGPGRPARGGVLGLLTDLRVRQLDGVQRPLLGASALTMTAPAAFARAHGAPLVPVRCVRRGAGYVLSAEEPLRLRTDLERVEATHDLLDRQNQLFGRWIAETPEQWAWHQRRW